MNEYLIIYLILTILWIILAIMLSIIFIYIPAKRLEDKSEVTLNKINSIIKSGEETIKKIDKAVSSVDNVSNEFNIFKTDFCNKIKTFNPPYVFLGIDFTNTCK